MAIVGDAYVVVRAITSSVEADIAKAFNNVDRVGERAGKDISNGVTRGFNRSNRNGIFSARFIAESIAAKESFSSLTRAGYVLAPSLTAVSGIIGLLGTGFISLSSIIGAALSPALITLAGAFTAVGQAALTLKLALSGVAKAVQAGNKASKKSVSNTRAQEDAEENLAKAYERLAKARETAIEQIQQLGFDSEDAAISEKRAALELEKARETLARVSDLPPNSRARKEAELAFAEADLNYRRAIDKNNDLKKEEAKNVELSKDGADAVVLGQENVIDALRDLKKAKEAANLAEQGAGADAYADALSNLSKEAQSFVKYLVSIQSEFKKLKDAAGQKLFPQLETAIDNLVKNLFPALRPLLTETGDVLGRVAIRISEVVTSSENIRRLESIWRTNNTFIDNLGTAIGNLYEGFLILLTAAKPLVDAFGEFLKNTTGSWKETLKLDETTGKLTERFKIAKGILKDLGTIFGNVFGGFKNLVKANVGPGSAGEIFLTYFKDISLAFKNLKTIDGKPLKTFFADAAKNGTKLLDLLGNIIGGFIKLADNPELGVFLGQLNDVTTIFQSIGEDITKSLPSFGEFLIEFSKFVKLVTESGSITIFFDTLRSALEKLNNFLGTDFGKKLLEVSAAVLPVLAAIGLLGKTTAFFGKVLLGPIFSLGKFALGAKNLYSEIKFLGPGLQTLAIQAKDTALKLGTTLFNGAKAAGTGLLQLGKAIGGQLVTAFRGLAIVMAANPLGVLITVIGLLVVAFATLYTKSETFRNLIDGIGTSIKNGLGAAVDFVSTKFTSLISFITTLPSKIASAARGLWDGIKDSFKSAINFILAKWNALQFSLRFPDKIFGISLGPLSGKGFTLDTPNIPLLAKGGVVMPSAGGTLAQIGEAGRPERIEPLDPDGLSKRDKAIIETLSGGRGSGVNITINPSAGMDERELASIVSRQIAFQLRKGAA